MRWIVPPALLLALACPGPLPGPTRDASGSIVRSRAAVAAFRRSNPCPATGLTAGACAGWVVDHQCPLACGGRDDPSNMHWQTEEDARAKDRWERTQAGCETLCGGGP